jgi:GUN4-like
MFEIVSRQQEGWLRKEDIQNFPSEDLQTIDHLWVKYSSSRFGFSIQKKILQDCGSPKTLTNKFGEAVGWKSKGFLSGWLSSSELIFHESAPVGHLPTTLVFCEGGWNSFGGMLLGGIVGTGIIFATAGAAMPAAAVLAKAGSDQGKVLRIERAWLLLSRRDL